MYNVGTEYMYIQKTTTIGKMYNDLAELWFKRENISYHTAIHIEGVSTMRPLTLPDPRQRLVQIRDFSGRPEP